MAATQRPPSSEDLKYYSAIVFQYDTLIVAYTGSKTAQKMWVNNKDGSSSQQSISGSQYYTFLNVITNRKISNTKITKNSIEGGAAYTFTINDTDWIKTIPSFTSYIRTANQLYGEAANVSGQSDSNLKYYSYILESSDNGFTLWFGNKSASTALVNGQLIPTARFTNWFTGQTAYKYTYRTDTKGSVYVKIDSTVSTSEIATSIYTAPTSTFGSGPTTSTSTTSTETTSSDPTVDTESDIDVYASDTITWNGQKLSWDEFYQVIESENGDISMVQDVDDSTLETSLTGIFGLPYQFSKEVDAPMKDSNIGRKYSEKILSLAPVLFLTPGEPVFMQGYGWDEKLAVAGQFVTSLATGDADGAIDAITTEGRYYSFSSNFPEFKLYANAALRALAYYMGIADCTVPIPGKNKTCTLKKLDIEAWMSNDFVRNFGAQNTIPFFLDAETQISEDFSNDTSESIISSFENKFSSAAREIQYIMGSKDSGGLVSAMKDIVGNLGSSIGEAVGGLTDVFVGKTLLSDISNQLSTIVSGGRIIFPEIWSGSGYNKNYSISLKLRSPDPDPVSIYMNIYMPIILLISMTAPRQLNMSPNTYESPFMVRATYKSIFTCDLGLITSLSINKGGEDKWNVMGQPVVADVQLNIKDMYSDAMPVSKYWGLLRNTAQMDYLAMCAGVDLNLYEPDRLLNLASIIIDNGLTDFVDNKWGQLKRWANQKSAQFLGVFSDTRFLQ